MQKKACTYPARSLRDFTFGDEKLLARDGNKDPSVGAQATRCVSLACSKDFGEETRL